MQKGVLEGRHGLHFKGACLVGWAIAEMAILGWFSVSLVIPVSTPKPLFMGKTSVSVSRNMANIFLAILAGFTCLDPSSVPASPFAPRSLNYLPPNNFLFMSHAALDVKIPAAAAETRHTRRSLSLS